MNYEQKYKSALEWMRSIYPTMQGADKEDAEHHFPELRESEDEKIRKDLITYINSIKGDTLDLTMRAHEWLCWLEKQKDKKPIIAVDSDQLLKILPRTAEWSEEDEHCIELLLPIIDSSSLIPKNRKKCKNFLQSLKPNHWKPSEEQMEALKKRTKGLHTNSETRKVLESLIFDLQEKL